MPLRENMKMMKYALGRKRPTQQGDQPGTKPPTPTARPGAAANSFNVQPSASSPGPSTTPSAASSTSLPATSSTHPSTGTATNPSTGPSIGPSTGPSTGSSTGPSTGPSANYLRQDLWDKAYEALCAKDPRLGRALHTILYEQSQQSVVQPGQPPGQTQASMDNFPYQTNIINGIDPNNISHASSDPPFRYVTRLSDVITAKLDIIEKSRLKLRIGNHDIIVRDKIEKIIQRIINFQTPISSLAAADPHASMAWAGISILLTIILQASRQDATAIAVLDFMSEIMIRYAVIDRLYLCRDPNKGDFHSERLSKHRDLQNLQVSLESKIIKLLSILLETQIRLACHYSKSTTLRFLRDLTISDNWQENWEELKKLHADINHSLATFDQDALRTLNEQCALIESIEHTVTSISTKVSSIEINQLSAETKRAIDSLPVVNSADMRSLERQADTGCLPNTRTELLIKIMQWSGTGQTSHVQSSQNIFWLCGMAGTGKSTIARTIAQDLHQLSYLAANFFFSKFDEPRSSAKHFITTIAAQLVEAIPGFGDLVATAIQENPNISGRALQEQWSRLIDKPLRDLNNTGKTGLVKPRVIVVDALDECKREHVKQLLELFARIKTIPGNTLRLLLTSRPESDVILGFKSIPTADHQDFILHNIEDSIIEHDIAIYYKYHTEKIRERHEYLDSQWITQEDIKSLVKRSGRLFIHAATTCRYLENEQYAPEERLHNLLSGPSTSKIASSTRELDLIYLIVLETSIDKTVDKKSDPGILREFHDVVDPIVVALEPISINSLSQITGSHIGKFVRRLNHLHSVLDIPASGSNREVVQILHPSFPEFLFDEERCTNLELLVHQDQAHRNMADYCVHLLEKSLKRNICQLESPGTLIEEIPPRSLEEFISPALRYASRYWMEHFIRSKASFDDIGPFILRFLRCHFLHWVEVLALLGKFDDAVSMVLQIEAEHTRGGTAILAELGQLLYDCKRWVLRNRRPIELAPLQIYFAALTFIPENSVISSLFHNEKPQYYQRPIIIEEDWPAALSVLEGHPGWLTALSFSADGQLVASASMDRTVRLWSTRTGALRAVLEGHYGYINAVLFSPDRSGGQLIASASDDNTVRLWNSTGALQTVLEGHFDRVNAISFSPDGQLLASVSNDGTLRLWDIERGTSRVLKCESGLVKAVSFSPNSQLIVSKSENTVQLWDITGALRAVFKDRIRAVAISPDSHLVACACYDNTVRLLDTTGTLQADLDGHTGSVKDLSFSPDGQLIASASYDGTVRLWNTTTRMLKAKLKDDFSIDDRDNSVLYFELVSFSPDGRLVASAANDYGVRLWDTTTHSMRAVLRGHSDWISSISFSPNGQVLATASCDRTLRLWDPTIVTRETSQVKSGGHAKLIPSGVHPKVVTSVASSRNGQLIATTSEEDVKVRLWDAMTGTPRGVLDHHSTRVMAVSFSPDGQLLASALGDGTMRLWDTITGISKGVLRGHSDRITTVLFSPDGQLLASASDDETVRLWDVVTGASKGVLRGHFRWVTAVSFSSDGQLLASASKDKTVRLWSIQEMCYLMEFDGKHPLYNLFLKSKAQFWKNISLSTTQSSGPVLLVENPPSYHLELSLDSSRSWVTFGGARWLWLPPELRPDYSDTFVTASGNLCIGTASGQVLFIILAPGVDRIRADGR